MGNKRIKKAVIREDLLFITGYYRKAIILNQFIYWAERVQDADDFIKFENEIARKNEEAVRRIESTVDYIRENFDMEKLIKF